MLLIASSAMFGLQRETPGAKQQVKGIFQIMRCPNRRRISFLELEYVRFIEVILAGNMADMSSMEYLRILYRK